MTKVKRFVVYGYPWFTSNLRHAVEINVLEPDVAVNHHIPIELEEERHLSIKESFEKFFRERDLGKTGYWRQNERYGKGKGQIPRNLYRRAGHGGLIR